jgi:hypothetical protein
MPKPSLASDQARLERDLITTFIAAFKEWRPDLQYPESYSDMEAGMRGIMQMFEIKRAPLPKKLEYAE